MLKKVIAFIGFFILLLFGFFLFLVNANALEFGVDYDSYYDLENHSPLGIESYDEVKEYITEDLINRVLYFGFDYANNNNFRKSKYVLWGSYLIGDFSANGSQEIMFILKQSDISTYKMRVFNNTTFSFSFNENNDFDSDRTIHILYNIETDSIYSLSANPSHLMDYYISYYQPFSFILSTNVDEIEFLTSGSSRNNFYINLNDDFNGVVSRGSTFDIRYLFHNGFIPRDLDVLDMKNKYGVVFYFKNHNLERKSQEFVLNGWYTVSYYKKVLSELSSIYELIPNGDLEVDRGDSIDNFLIINYSRQDYTWYDNVYYFWNKNSISFLEHSILYDSYFFDYSYINEDGTLSKPISFIDENDEEQTIDFINVDYLPYYKNINFYGVSDIIKLPLRFISSLSKSTCNPLVLPVLDKDLTIPCMRDIYKSAMGDTLWNIFQTIFTGVVSYYVVVQYMRYIKEFKSPDNDKIEVMEL